MGNKQDLESQAIIPNLLVFIQKKLFLIIFMVAGVFIFGKYKDHLNQQLKQLKQLYHQSNNLIQLLNNQTKGLKIQLKQIQIKLEQEKKEALQFKEKIVSLQQTDIKFNLQIVRLNKSVVQSMSQTKEVKKQLLTIMESIQENNQKSVSQAKKINQSLVKLQNQINLEKKAVLDIKKQMETFTSQINQLHRNQLSKQEKGFQIFQRFSKKYPLVFSQKIDSFKQHYKFSYDRKTVTKISNQQNNAFLYPLVSIPDDSIYYFSIKIKKTQRGSISIGIFTHKKKLNKNLECGYCADNQMYYLHGNNGRIYHGRDYSLFYKYKNSRFESFKSGDNVTVFVDTNLQHVTWYINGRYAQSKFLQSGFAKQQLYPFVLITDKNDEIMLE